VDHHVLSPKDGISFAAADEFLSFFSFHALLWNYRTHALFMRHLDFPNQVYIGTQYAYLIVFILAYFIAFYISSYKN